MTRFLLLVLAVVAAGAAQAQSYAIEQAGHRIGSFELRLAAGADGLVSTSTLELNQLATLTDRLTTDAQGHATGYHLEGTARGAPVTIDASIRADGATITVDQGGQTARPEVPLTGPVYVIDNSMLDGWQVVARRLGADAEEPWSGAVLVPQAAQAGTLTLTPGPRERVEADGGTVDARRVDARLAVGPQVVALQLWLDADGGIVAFAQPSAQLRYVRQPAAPTSGGGASADPARQALERTLDAQRACFEERDVTVRSTGETLAGSLTLPHAGRPVPALLLLPGSGAVDRDGNEPPLITNGMYRQLAYALSCQGYAVLRVDKLGIGASSGDGNAVTLDTYARNTADWIDLLRHTDGIDPRRIGLLGHSEGGLVALYTVARGVASPTAVVLLAGPGLPLGRVVADQLVAQARRAGQSQEQVDALAAQTRSALDAIRASTGVQLPLEGDLADNPVAQMFAHAAGLLRSEIDVDPAALAARVRVPMLIVQGGKDLQVDERNGEALHAAAPQATYLVLPDMSHMLARVAGPAASGLLPDAGTPVSDTLLGALRTYLAGFVLAGP